MKLPDPCEQPTMRVEEAGRLFFDFGRAKSYAEAARYERTGGLEGLPCIRFGRTLRAVTAACIRLVELDQRGYAERESDDIKSEPASDRPPRGYVDGTSPND